jgi:DNA-directed RNA polymerase specialized sigma24 family protein
VDEEFVNRFYEHLRRAARRFRGPYGRATDLNTTAVVHEAYRRLATRDRNRRALLPGTELSGAPEQAGSAESGGAAASTSPGERAGPGADAASANGVSAEPGAELGPETRELGGVGPCRTSEEARLLALARQTMRSLLAQDCRERMAAKRNHGVPPVSLTAQSLGLTASVDPAELEEALEWLRCEHPRASEALELRYFAGRSRYEVAQWMRMSPREVTRLVNFARVALAARVTPPST